MLKLTDEQFQEKERKPVFSNGEAGVVLDCIARIEKRKAEDNANGPKYKIYFTDPNNKAEVNRGYFVPNIKNPKQEGFFMREMNHILNQCGLPSPDKAFNSHEEILDYVMVSSKDAIKEQKFGVAVCFGTADRPASYLEVDGFWGFRNMVNITDANPLKLSDKALRVRIEPTQKPNLSSSDFDIPKQPKSSDDLPF